MAFFFFSILSHVLYFQVQEVVQQVGNIIRQSLIIHNKLEGSLHELSRTGEILTCKSTRKAVENSWKELSKELKPLPTFLKSSPQASRILLKVRNLSVKFIKCYKFSFSITLEKCLFEKEYIPKITVFLAVRHETVTNLLFIRKVSISLLKTSLKNNIDTAVCLNFEIANLLLVNFSVHCCCSMYVYISKKG